MNPLIIEGPEPGGQLTTTTEVENFPGFPEGIMGPELMDNMRKQAERFGAEFITGWVNTVDMSKRPFKLQVEGQGELQAKPLLSQQALPPNILVFRVRRKMSDAASALVRLATDSFFRGKKIIVVGGGDSAMEEANFLTRFASEVELVHRRDELRASKIMQDRARENEKISWSLNRTPIEVVAGGMGVTGLKVRNNATGEEEVIETDGIFIAIGHTPNTKFLGGQFDTDEHGYMM